MWKKSYTIVQSGRLEFRKINVDERDWRDVYHWLLTLTWPQFAGLILGIYLAINLFFAGLYFLGTSCIAGMPPHSFPYAFFFSVETLATVGYGHMYPNSLYGHLVATVEIMSGMFGMAVITGLIFIRFSRPSARLQYSRHLVLGTFDGQPALMVRVANLRHQAMAEAEFRFMLIRNERIQEEESTRRFYTLRLQFDRIALFPAVLTLRHLIDEESPLYGRSPADWEQGDYRFFVSVICIDTVIPASVHSQQTYTWSDVRFGHRFVEIYTELDHDRMEVDYGRLSETEPFD